MDRPATMSSNSKRNKGGKGRGGRHAAAAGEGRGAAGGRVLTEAELARRRSMALFTELLRDRPPAPSPPPQKQQSSSPPAPAPAAGADKEEGASCSTTTPLAAKPELGHEQQQEEGEQTGEGSAGTTSLMLEELGIGGLDVQVKTLLRRALASRLMAPELASKLQVKHVRGILLHGPPGTGKTLIARQLGRLLNAREPKLISGPELLSMWVGKSEENIRKIFEDAEREFAEKGKDSGLHLVIFDEIDALSRKRGSLRDSSGVMDSCVNQLLAKIDGLLGNDNVLVIGTTNRKDLLDDALLRPGRLEVHVEVGLPDLSGRQQVFRVHTAPLLTHGALGRDVDLWELARRSQNFTGAEIEGVVKSALSFALQRQISEGGQQQPYEEEEGGAVLPVVSMLDLLRGLKEAKPHYALAGSAQELEARHLPLGLLPFRPEVDALLQTAASTILHHASAVTAAAAASGAGKTTGTGRASQPQLPVLCLLLRGPRGAGKTALLARLACLCASAYTFRRLVRASDLDLQGGQHDDGSACEALGQALLDAHQCPSSLLLLDDLEALAHYTNCGTGHHHRNVRVSAPRLHTLIGMLGGRLPPPGRVCCVVASSSLEEEVLQGLGLWQCFNGLVLELPLVETVAHARSLLNSLQERRQDRQQRQQARIADGGAAKSTTDGPLGCIEARLPLPVREALQLALLHHPGTPITKGSYMTTTTGASSSLELQDQ